MKKVIALIMAVTMLSMCAIPLCAENEVVLGDVNSNGIIDLSDTAEILKYCAKWELQGEFNMEAADANRDGVVNISDVSRHLQYLAKWHGDLWGPYFP